MMGTEFIDQLVRDKAELEALREAKAVEEERAAGRRNRRDRRRAREQVGTKERAGGVLKQCRHRPPLTSGSQPTPWLVFSTG